MMSDNGDLCIYIFQDNEGEKVPENVEELIVNPGIQVLPGWFCYNCVHLRQVELPIGVERIGRLAFASCVNLLEIKICNTVRLIGREAFHNCMGLKKIEFEEDEASAPHQLQTIDIETFMGCKSLPRINLPSSVNGFEMNAFEYCDALVEANLSKTCIAEISMQAFAKCKSLQTVSLPKTLERIGVWAFSGCSELVTVVVPLDSQPISIGHESFQECRQLANLVLPRDSIRGQRSFLNCEVLRDCFGRSTYKIVAGLKGRFEGLPVHGMCYDHSAITAPELRQCIEDQEEVEYPFADAFGMTPFHIHFSTSGPRVELLEILLDQYGGQSPRILYGKDANGKRALDYLISNWTGDATAELLQLTLQKCMLDRLVYWGKQSWAEEMTRKVETLILAEHDKEQRVTLSNDVYSAFGHYSEMASLAILEMTLWKWKLESVRNNDGSEREALDRGECQCVCGSNVVIPNVLAFLGVT